MTGMVAFCFQAHTNNNNNTNNNKQRTGME